MTMRLFALAAIGVTTFAATMTFETSNANAVVYCVEGVYRAGCVVRPGVAPVRGVARRTTRRVVRRRSDMTLKQDKGWPKGRPVISPHVRTRADGAIRQDVEGK